MADTDICSECRMAIPGGARRCGHCGANLAGLKGDLYAHRNELIATGVIVLVLVALVLFAI